MVHTFIFDGDQDKDFIRGLGIRFTVPMRDGVPKPARPPRRRQRLFAEPVHLIAGRRNPSPDLYAKQIAGQPIPNLANLPSATNVAQMAAWDRYKLTPSRAPTPTRSKSAPIRRAPGSTPLRRARRWALAFVGDASGGLAVGVKDFWQTAPTDFEIDHAATPTPRELTLWLWSPRRRRRWTCAITTPARTVSTCLLRRRGARLQHARTGIARTTRTHASAFADVPPTPTSSRWRDADAAAAAAWSARRNIITRDTPSASGACPIAPHPRKQWIEDQLDTRSTFYQRRRSSSAAGTASGISATSCTTTISARHEWRYDVGGCAWDNTELVPDMWLWYTFLRTGRADVFRMAEAMTRHTQRSRRLPPRPLRRPRLAAQRPPLGRRREGSAHQPGAFSSGFITT